MRRTKNRTIVLCIGLIILSLLSAILSIQVSGKMPNDKGVENEQR